MNITDPDLRKLAEKFLPEKTDSDLILILIILYILIKNQADYKLILALCYIII